MVDDKNLLDWVVFLRGDGLNYDLVVYIISKIFKFILL